MRFDTSTFPIVWLHAVDNLPDDEISDFAKFERLLDRRQSLVFITNHTFCSCDSSDANLTRRKIEWLRRHRPQLQSQVKALIQIEPDARKRRDPFGFARLFFSFWGYPLLIVEDEIDAVGLALELLTGELRHREGMRCFH
ncbi:hypothetical protein At15955_50240 (plasmid) [Agrobacterium tumefaciens]|nr:hypothetical protein Ach5_48630 [Agrobacterium tumefaciens]AYM20009.1 hypothetical protein At15955_50240 [Agrobacterium tumefaciens]AYM71312.1 hypothetical protein AtA6_50960 [Agrobacterium tumefaciens]